MENYDSLKLIKLAQNDNSMAKEILMKQNSPLIKSVIKRFIGKGIEYDDLYQLGSMGFLKAIYNFDERFNVKFSTYAVPMIAGEVKRFMRDNGIIKVSRSVKTMNININKYIEAFMKENYRSPNIDEIAKHFEIERQEVVYIMESSQQPISYNMPVGDDDNNKQALIEKIENTSLDSDMDMFLIYKIIKNLCERDKKIIMLRYFRDKTQKEVAKIIGVSQVQISRLENKILSEIRSKVQ